MVQAREVQLETAISAAKCSGGLEQEVKNMERELALQRKKAAEPVSVLSQIDFTKAFVERAEKRKGAVTKQIESLRAEEAKMDREIHEAKERLKNLEVDAAKILHCSAPIPDDSAMSLLLKSCMDLLQEMESASILAQGPNPALPTSVLDAMRNMHATVEPIRPFPQPCMRTGLGEGETEDMEEMMDESSLMVELTEEESDEKLLNIAKRLRAKRLRVN